MFTGIVTEIGKVKGITRKGTLTRLEIKCKRSGANLKIGDSVAVNGVCLSIVEKNNSLFFDVVKNTLDKTNLKRLKIASLVNLEGPLKLGDTLSGHMVSGHIDAERRIKDIRKTPQGMALDIEVLLEDVNHLVPRASVAIDGVSLTVSELYKSLFRIYLIPHTLENTTLSSKRPGDYVNIEFDMLGKYSEKSKQQSVITKEFLAEKGFM